MLPTLAYELAQFLGVQSPWRRRDLGSKLAKQFFVGDLLHVDVVKRAGHDLPLLSANDDRACRTRKVEQNLSHRGDDYELCAAGRHRTLWLRRRRSRSICSPVAFILTNAARTSGTSRNCLSSSSEKCWMPPTRIELVHAV